MIDTSQEPRAKSQEPRAKNKTEQKIKHHSKWCLECGRAVDLRNRKSMQLKEEFATNPEYRYVCFKCADLFREKMRVLR